MSTDDTIELLTELRVSYRVEVAGDEPRLIFGGNDDTLEE